MPSAWRRKPERSTAVPAVPARARRLVAQAAQDPPLVRLTRTLGVIPQKRDRPRSLRTRRLRHVLRVLRGHDAARDRCRPRRGRGRRSRPLSRCARPAERHGGAWVLDAGRPVGASQPSQLRAVLRPTSGRPTPSSSRRSAATCPTRTSTFAPRSSRLSCPASASPCSDGRTAPCRRCGASAWSTSTSPAGAGYQALRDPVRPVLRGSRRRGRPALDHHHGLPASDHPPVDRWTPRGRACLALT